MNKLNVAALAAALSVGAVGGAGLMSAAQAQPPDTTLQLVNLQLARGALPDGGARTRPQLTAGASRNRAGGQPYQQPQPPRHSKLRCSTSARRRSVSTLQHLRGTVRSCRHPRWWSYRVKSLSWRKTSRS